MKTRERLRYVKEDVSLEMGSRTVHYSMRMPEKLVSEEIALIVPGIMAKRRLYNPFARDLAERGVASVTMAHESASPLCTDEVVAVVESLADNGQKPIRLIGHSLGGMHATKAALQAPDDISGLLLMQPAGYGGVHPLHFASSLRERPDNTRLSDEIRVLLDGIDYLVSSRPDLLLQTIVTASRHQVLERAIHLESHISRDAILFPDDRLIRTGEVQKGLAQAGFTMHELDARIHAGHNAIMYRADAVADQTVAIMKNTGFMVAA